jgi:hypothetical protein
MLAKNGRMDGPDILIIRATFEQRTEVSHSPNSPADHDIAHLNISAGLILSTRKFDVSLPSSF